MNDVCLQRLNGEEGEEKGQGACRRLAEKRSIGEWIVWFGFFGWGPRAPPTEEGERNGERG
jgi:hypothetical protein